MSKFGFLAIAALALGLSGVPAMALPAVSPPAMHTIVPPLITPVKKTFHGNFPGYRGNYYRVPRYNYGHYHNDYRRRYHGDRYYGRRYYGRRCYGWDGYYCGPYYGGPFLGFGFGSGIVVTPRRYTYANRHVQWCLNRYRSYNPRNNTWVAYSGRVRQCISPFSR